MEELLPSEVARLILGFLKENNCEKSWNIFLEECSDLYEYNLLYKRGKCYSTNVNGKSLLNILKEYCILKDAAEKNSSIAKFYEIFSEEKVKVILEESAIKVVEQVIQKYLPCFCKKSPQRSDLHTDVIQIDHVCDHNLDKSIELESKTEKMDQSNIVILEKNTSKEINGSSVQLQSIDCDINSSTEEFISNNICKSNSLDHNLQLVERSVSDRIYMHDIVKVEKDSEKCTFLEHKSRDDCSRNREINCHTSSIHSECIKLLQSTENNSGTVESFNKVSTTPNPKHNAVKPCERMQTDDYFSGKLNQTIKVEPDSSVNSIDQIEGSNYSQNDTVTHLVDYQNSSAETNKTEFCSTQSSKGLVNMANSTNPINNQPGYAIQPFASQSLPFSNMSYSSLPTYFVQNCPSESPFLQNNSHYSLIINTPATGTAATFPLSISSIIPSNNGPTLTSVTSLSSHDQPAVLSLSSNSSSNMNSAADSINSSESQTDSTAVLHSASKETEASFAAPAKTVKKITLKSNLLAHKSSKKAETFSRKRVKMSSKGTKNTRFRNH